MPVTTRTLTRAAAVAAMAGGLLFIAVQINHPHLTAGFVTTREYALREAMKIAMAVLSLIGVTGIYLRQVRQTGVLGLIGYVVLGLGYLAILSNQVVAVFVLPILAPHEPQYVTDVLGVATSRPPVGDIGALQSFIQLGGGAYIVGGILFGVALFRAGILARWAAALLAVGGVATIATFVLPELVQRLFAFPVSIALVGLGYSLWREQRTQAVRPLTGTHNTDGTKSSRLDPAGAR